MSFAVSLESPRLEWAGSSLATVFGQKRNLVRPEFWRMLGDILRFNRESVAWLLRRRRRCHHPARLPRSPGATRAPSPTGTCCRWRRRSGPARPGRMLDYPLATFVRFCHNHGLLQVLRPAAVAYRARGGGREYVNKLAEASRTSASARRCSAASALPRGVLLAHADRGRGSIRWCSPAIVTRLRRHACRQRQRSRAPGASRHSLPAEPGSAAYRRRAAAARAQASGRHGTMAPGSDTGDGRPVSCLLPDQPPAAAAVFKRRWSSPSIPASSQRRRR
jgi:hypothetical protein